MRYFVCLMLALELSAAVWKPVAVETLKAPELWGFEENKGQAKTGVLFQARGGAQSIAVDAKGVAFSPNGVRIDFVGANLNAGVRFGDGLPGLVNAYSGGDETLWARGLKRYARAQIDGVFPGVSVTYVAAADTSVTMRVKLAPGVDPTALRWEIAGAVRLFVQADGGLAAAIIDGKPYYGVAFPAPVASGGKVRWALLGTRQFGFVVEDRNPLLPLTIEVQLGKTGDVIGQVVRTIRGVAGDVYSVGYVVDAAGKDAPFPEIGWAGCSAGIAMPVPCIDVWVAKYSSTGILQWVSYLEGGTNEYSGYLGFAADGNPTVSGTTNSAAFPTSRDALQRKFAGPNAAPYQSGYQFTEGDLFLSRLDARDGALLRSTFWGGPGRDAIGQTEIGADGSIYLFPKLFGGRVAAGAPTSASALQRSCDAGDVCQNGYAARFSDTLDRVIYATYLPGNVIAGKRGPDGSVYFVGSGGKGFPVSATAYQKTMGGGLSDAVIGRLDPNGGRLLFGTYWGTEADENILFLAVSPDGSVWVNVSVSGGNRFAAADHRLLRVDAAGESVLVDRAIAVSDLFVDTQGRLYAIANSLASVSPDALSMGRCGPGYFVLRSSGEEVIVTQLPVLSSSEFAGTSASGRPTMASGGGVFEVDETQAGDVFGACVVDAAGFVYADVSSPGAIVTIWGSKMGPAIGVGFSGAPPRDLAGTRLLVNGKPAPLLYVSANQVNAILPFDLSGTATLQLEREGRLGNAWNVSVAQAGNSLFRRDGSALRPAAALNEDGTLNSPQNPAKKGSRVVLFGTGGGVTSPRSVEGEVTPLALVRLESAPSFRVGNGGPNLTPEFAGAAPGLVAGVTQFNLKLPEVIADVPGYPKGVVPVVVITPQSSFFQDYVTISVEM